MDESKTHYSDVADKLRASLACICGYVCIHFDLQTRTSDVYLFSILIYEEVSAKGFLQWHYLRCRACFNSNCSGDDSSREIG